MATATIKQLKKTAVKTQSPIGNLNRIALQTTEDLIDGTIETGQKWQHLYAKSLKNSTPVINKNIDLAFDTIESLIDQYQNSSRRIMKLFGFNIKTVETVKTSPKKTVTNKKTTPIKKKATAKSSIDVNNLKLINGIGPKMEKLLQNNGYTTINMIAISSTEDLKKILETADARYRLLNPESWIVDAQKLLK